MILGNSYKFQAGNRMNAMLWFKHLSAACQSNKQQVSISLNPQKVPNLGMYLRVLKRSRLIFWMEWGNMFLFLFFFLLTSVNKAWNFTF